VFNAITEIRAIKIDSFFFIKYKFRIKNGELFDALKYNVDEKPFF